MFINDFMSNQTFAVTGQGCVNSELSLTLQGNKLRHTLYFNNYF